MDVDSVVLTWKMNSKRRAEPFNRLQLDRGIQHVAQPLDDGQADAFAGVRGRGVVRATRLGLALQRVRQGLPRVGMNSGAGILNGQHPAFAIVRLAISPADRDPALAR